MSNVGMLGFDAALILVQDDQGLTVTPGESVMSLPGTGNQTLALSCRILRIIHDKGWLNDDAPYATYPGWIRRCNMDTSDFNNDLVTSATPGDVWSCSFTGSSVTVIAPKEAGVEWSKFRLTARHARWRIFPPRDQTGPFRRCAPASPVPGADMNSPQFQQGVYSGMSGSNVLSYIDMTIQRPGHFDTLTQEQKHDS